VEGLVRSGVAPSFHAAQLEVASRTDRGVHARANALAITSHLGGGALLTALNGISPHVFFTAAREVPVGFSVRTARARWYRYFEPSESTHLDRWRAAAQLFRGHVDVRSFGAGVPLEAPVWRKIDRVSVRPVHGLLQIDVHAPSFVWKEVRKIVGALRAHDRGRVPLSRLRQGIEGRRRLSLPLAEPDRLILWEVQYDEPWTFAVAGAHRGRYGRAVMDARHAARVRAAVLEGLRPEPSAMAPRR
jgi:tRNA pseudouridine(38-40) synthase